jgi:hypothetical protein
MNEDQIHGMIRSIPLFDPEKEKLRYEAFEGPICEQYLMYSFLLSLRRLPYDKDTNPREDKLVLVDQL